MNTLNASGKAKLFIYVDDYKMYSLSSQLFGGFVSSLTEERSRSVSESEEQKGPYGSGRVLADIASNETRQFENRIIHDYAYTLFEEKLESSRQITSISSPIAWDTLQDSKIIKIKGEATLLDLKATTDFIKMHNKFGESLAYVMTHEDRKNANQMYDSIISSAKDRNQRAQHKAIKSKINSPEKIAESLGFRLDDNFLKHLEILLSHGFGDHYELRIPVASEDVVFTSILNRKFLRESEELLVKKYARHVQVPFTVVGIVTQSKSPDTALSTAENSDAKPAGTNSSEAADSTEVPENAKASIRKGLLSLISGLSAVEGAFNGIEPGEVIIDPIAVYREL